uniref:Chitin-binding type-2 domain-containing protein n=1 Tax=Aceria tosichella TaxID=561515 RepID=A0A6G1SBI0_9ACAR
MSPPSRPVLSIKRNSIGRRLTFAGLQTNYIVTLLIPALAVSCIIIASLVSESFQVGLGSKHVEHRRFKRALYDLPAGSELLLSGQLRTTFTCDGLGYGYYADPDNECKIFHICQSFKMSDGSIYNNHWSFICPNQTLFNQVSLTCSHPDEAVPCQFAREFYNVNDYFGDVRSPSVKETDLSQANELISRAYGSRLSGGGGTES